MKMSKSKGNAIDPLPLIERLGADVFRFWSAGEVTHGYDFRCNEVKIESAKKFLSKLWNISRFISSFPVIDEADLEPTDKWIMSELDNLVSKCKKGYDEYNFFIPAVAIREFMWNLFAAFIYMLKSKIISMCYHLHYCNLLQLMQAAFLLVRYIIPFYYPCSDIFHKYDHTLWVS